MKNTLKLLAIFLSFTVLLTAFVAGEKEIETLKIGDSAPLIKSKMSGIDGKKSSLESLKKSGGLLVIFSCNTCPFVVGNGEKEGWEGRYNQIAEDCNSKDIGMVLINSNEAKRDKGDNLEDMKTRAKKLSYQMAYVLDEKSNMANAFGARTTPHVFLFDKDLKLVYEGKIDENVNSANEVKEPYLRNALQNLKEGKEINPNKTKAMGCSIKRV